MPRRSSGTVVPTPPQANVANALRLFLVILVGFSLFEWGFAFVHRYLLHAHYPYTTPLFDPIDRLADWTSLLTRAKHFSEPGVQLRPDIGPFSSYPLPCFYIYVFFVRAFPHPIRAYLIVACLIFLAAGSLFSLHLRKLRAGRLTQAAAWLTLALGSPALFLLDRGNIEVFLWLALALGLVAFVNDWKYLAAFCFSLAACMKLYPAIFLLLLLPRRHYKAFAFGAAATVLLSIAALAGVGPTISQALQDVTKNGRALQNQQLASSAERYLRWDHSLFAAAKQAVYRFDLATHQVTSQHAPQFPGMLRVYTFLAPAVFLLLYVFRLRRLPLLNQLIALTIFSILLPYASYEYTLVHLYLVWAAFLIFLQQDVATSQGSLSVARLQLMIVCFAVIIAPVTALCFEKFGGQLKCVALLVLLAAALRWPMPSTLFLDRLVPPPLDDHAHPDISLRPQEESA